MTEHEYIDIEQDCVVLERIELNPENFLLELHSPAIASAARPGQFVNLRTSTFLRRPLGIASVDRQRGTFTVGFLVKGEGTKALAGLQAGSTVSVLGPLGHGFDLDGITSAVAVGGGTGVFPLRFLLEDLEGQGIRTAAALGFRSSAQVILEEHFRTASACVLIASEAGDLPLRGTVMQALEAVWAELNLSGDAEMRGTAILACGPLPMLAAVAAFAQEKGAACQVSLEERMGCGTGYCRTCSCKTRKGPDRDDWTYDRVCVEGPVFPAERVIFHAD